MAESEWEEEPGWSGWQAPTAELSEALLAQLLCAHDVAGAEALAATSRHWAGVIAQAEPCWAAAMKQRWAVWLEVRQSIEPAAITTWLAGGAEEGKEVEAEPYGSCDAPAPTCSWRTAYLVWSKTVHQAVNAALLATDLQAEPSNAKEGSVMYKLWARPLTRDIEFLSWEKALEVMAHARLGPADIAQHFLTSDSALVNFLGTHYLMMEPWVEKAAYLPPTKAHYPKESVPYIQSLLEQHGCAHKRVVVRWWELGMLAMGAGWRSNDQMHTMDSSMGPMLRNASFWRMLLRGVQLEVRRIVISEE